MIVMCVHDWLHYIELLGNFLQENLLTAQLCFQAPYVSPQVPYSEEEPDGRVKRHCKDNGTASDLASVCDALVQSVILALWHLQRTRTSKEVKLTKQIFS